MFRNIVFLRSYCDHKAAAKKSWHFVNKQLFGGVIKKKSKKLNATAKPQPAVEARQPLLNPEFDRSSEAFWILNSTPSKIRTYPKQSDNASSISRTTSEPKKSQFQDILTTPLCFSPGGGAPSAIPELLNYEVPSVGKVLQATMSEGVRRALKAWKLAKIEELGEDGFAALQRENLNRGLRFHNSLQDYFTGIMPDTEDLVWQSLQSVVPEIERKALFVEKRVVHPVLKYKGVVDCVSSIGDTVFAIEWKNSEKPKPSISATYDAPLQLCAYLGALNAAYNMEISSGMVVVGYTNGRPADYFKLDERLLRKYWYAWLLRLQEYYIRYRDGTLPTDEL